MSYFRKNISLMQGYIPGEQPRDNGIIKLNTNENPYPPAPKVIESIKNTNFDLLRTYPNPTSDDLRKVIAEIYSVPMSTILVGNGSDDILTIIMRSFVPEGGILLILILAIRYIKFLLKFRL